MEFSLEKRRWPWLRQRSSRLIAQWVGYTETSNITNGVKSPRTNCEDGNGSRHGGGPAMFCDVIVCLKIYIFYFRPLINSDFFFFSIVEVFGDSDSGISVLRSFRLLRIFKLVRFLPALRRQLLVMIHTMDNVLTFLALLALFIFTASILGMNLFGGKYDFPNESGQPETARANFDDLFWALVTVFQVRMTDIPLETLFKIFPFIAFILVNMASVIGSAQFVTDVTELILRPR